MAKISDKHGLTNKYRPLGTGKRVVKRGRSRKRFCGSRSTFSRPRVPQVETQRRAIVCAVIASILAGIAFIFILPLFTPLFIGIPLVYVIDEGLKKKMGLKRGKGSLPTSILWIVISTFEMLFCMGALAVRLADDTVSYAPLFISLAVYISLSILILKRRYVAILKKQGAAKSQEIKSSSQSEQLSS